MGFENPEVLIPILIAAFGTVIAYLEYKLHKKEMFEERIIQPLTSAKEFYGESERIHRAFSKVRIISKTPGLILPSERNLASFRRKYFQTIYSRLDEYGDYQLKYLFDLTNVKEVLNEYKARGEYSRITEVKQMLSEALSYTNLDLRTTDTGPLMGMVIGGESIATIGFKEPTVRNLAEGVLVRSSELVRVFLIQFDTIFEKATKVKNVNFIDEILGEGNK